MGFNMNRSGAGWAIGYTGVSGVRGGREKGFIAPNFVTVLLTSKSDTYGTGWYSYIYIFFNNCDLHTKSVVVTFYCIFQFTCL